MHIMFIIHTGGRYEGEQKITVALPASGSKVHTYYASIVN